MTGLGEGTWEEMPWEGGWSESWSGVSKEPPKVFMWKSHWSDTSLRKKTCTEASGDPSSSPRWHKLRLRNVKKILRSSRKYSGKLKYYSQGMFEAPVVALRRTRGGSGMVGLCFLGCWGHPAGKGVWPGGLSTGAEEGPPESQSEELSSRGAWISELPLPQHLPLCHRAAWTLSSLCLFPAPKLYPRQHIVPLGASETLPPISTRHLSSQNGLPFTFHFPPQMPGKTTWRAPRAREIGGAVWVGADCESPGNCHMLGQCLGPAPSYLKNPSLRTFLLLEILTYITRNR